LREQTPESVEALRRLLGELVSWIIANTHPQRLLHAGQLEIFFDDTEIEVYGDHFEGAKINYKGDKALSWQTLWVGPLLADCYLGSPGDVSSRLLEMLERNQILNILPILLKILKNIQLRVVDGKMWWLIYRGALIL